MFNLIKLYGLRTESNINRFVDLGSGGGKAVFIAYLTGIFYSCAGIELLPRLYDDDDLYEDSVVAANADTIFHPMGSNANPNPTSNNSSAGNLLSLPRNVSANSLKIANFDRLNRKLILIII